MPTTQRVAATIPGGIYDKLAAIAESEGRTVASLAAFALETWVRQHSPPPDAVVELDDQIDNLGLRVQGLEDALNHHGLLE